MPAPYSVAAGVSSLLCGIYAWRRSPAPARLPPKELLLPAAGLVVPALFILWVKSSVASEDRQRERNRPAEANPK